MQTEHHSKDIRSLRFTPDSLTDKNFQGATAGHKFIHKLLILIVTITLNCFFSVISLLSSSLLGFIFDVEKFSYSSQFIEAATIIIYILCLLRIIIYGFELRWTAIITGSILISCIIYVVYEIKLGLVGIGGAWLFLSFSLALSLAGILFTAIFVAIASISCGILGAFLLIFVTECLVIAVIISVNSDSLISIIATTAIILSGAIVGQRTVQGWTKLAWIKKIAIFWAATFGTSFYELDLTDACFDGANLRHTDFRKTNLTHASFINATGLEFARLEGTILEDPKVRKLLTTNKGPDEDFTGVNLNGASLRNANLTGAILIKAQLLNADLSGASLTNACIQDWNINKNTSFKDVDCQRVYLKLISGRYLEEPKPDSGEFQPGEFEKWITDVRDTIDLIFQNGLNWRAFAFSLTQTAINNENVNLSIRSIENKGDGVVVAKLGVSLETNKSAIHEEITKHYYQAVQAIAANYELRLQAKDGEIERLKNFYECQQRTIQGLISGIAESKREVIIQGEGNRVYMMNQAGDIMESNNQNQISAGGNVDMSSGNRITIGGDVSNSNLTLADANSQVSNSIQQLSDISTNNSNDLAKILTILQKSITDDPVLSNDQKKQALEAVETMAEEGKKPQGERVIKFCSMAVNALKGVVSTVSDASELAKIFKTYLPTLSSLLGI